MANNKTYKRSWRNYLLDSSYQLRFTFTMLAVAAGLMAPLGWWVSQKAATSTEVALNQIDEIICPEILSATPAAAPTAPSDGAVEEDLLDEDAPAMPVPEPEPAPESDPAPESEPPPESGTVDGEPESSSEEQPGDRERQRTEIVVNIDDSDMPDIPVVEVVSQIEEAPPPPEAIEKSRVDRAACLSNVESRKDEVMGRKALITWLMVISGTFLLIGLGVYGIKTTHKVAGPLFKVGLYLKKLENNIYDTVYNLRKGDQLVEFYDHFKGAHAGVTTMQEEDRDRLRDAIKLAKDAGLVEKNKEMAEAVAELERLLTEKEESLVKKA